MTTTELNNPAAGRRSRVLTGISAEGARHLERLGIKLPAEVQLVEIPSSGELPEALEDVEFLIFCWVLWPRAKEVLTAVKNAKVIQTLSAGVDAFINVVPQGALLCNARGAHDVSVAEWTVAVILGWAHQLFALHRIQLTGHWERVNVQQALNGKPDNIPVLTEIADQEVLIVGYGSIGRAVAARLAPFGARVVGVASTARPDEGVHGLEELDKLLPSADVVVTLPPLLPSTRRMVNADFLGRMKHGALLVNPGRGGLVDQDALLAALNEGRVAAALDVADPEPLPDGHPLFTAPNTFLSPHSAGTTNRVWGRVYPAAVANLVRYVNREPLNNIANGKGY